MRLALPILLLPLAALADAPPAPGVLRPPLPGVCISSPFGERHIAGPRAAVFHYGIDLPAPAGAWVHPAAPGRVVAIRRLGAEGLEVDVRHDGYTTRYAHLGQVAPALATGQVAVTPADRIGRIGRTGITYGTHLHFEVIVDGRRLDPAPLLGVARCR